MEKYTTAEIKAKDPIKEKDKIEISNDAYAVCDFIEKLIKKVEHSRISAIRGR